MTAEFPLAVHALVYLMHTARVTTSEELADNICTNPARVRLVMSKLAHARLVEATRGKGSGYLFTGTESTSLKEILDALGEQPVAVNWHSGDIDRDCLVSSGMGAVMDELYGTLNERCRQELQQVTIAAINQKIFGRKKEE